MKQHLTLLTDFYQITMANGYWKTGRYQDEAIFHLFYRKAPFGGEYAIAAGLAPAIEYLQSLKFTLEDIRYLTNLKDADGKAMFEESFLNYLQRFEFACDVDAVPEGTIVYPHTPILRVKGPLIQVQLLETTLLNLINFSTLIATKASRIKKAAKGDTVLEFGLRRAQGPDGGLMASRAAYIGGCDATSNVLAGQQFGIPIKGTHAHSWVMSFDSEDEAFEAYTKAMPRNVTLLVDTYDTINGVKKAIEQGIQLRANGHKLRGIRLDSGDLAALSIEARKLLDEAGFQDTKIVASDSLDEYKIKELKDRGARIDIWGIGTRLATAYDQPALGGVFKLAAVRQPNTDWKYRMKLSENIVKVSNPGQLNTLRIQQNGQAVMDVMVNELEDKISGQLRTFQGETLSFEVKDATPLLQAIFRKGKCVYKIPTIHETRAQAIAQVALFDGSSDYPVGLEGNLHQLKTELLASIKAAKVSK